MKPRITIAGAGLSGALLAIFLARRGYAVTVFERRKDPRIGPMEAGRSINLALSHRGLAALEAVGAREAVMAEAIPMRGRRIHAKDGTLAFQSYGREEHHVIYAVSRADLNRVLVERAGALPGVDLRFEHRVLDCDLEGKSLTVRSAAGEEAAHPFEVCIACDGAFSAVRARLARQDRFDFSQSYLSHNYKELVIPPGPDGKHRMDRNALHIWPRGERMLIALPNPDGSFTCTLFLRAEGPHPSFQTVTTPEAAAAYFAEEFPDAVPLMPTLAEDFARNPAPSLVTMRCAPWSRGPVALLGDAAHAVVPFYGQGMNCAFEDAHVLSRLLDEAGDAPDWPALLARYAALRKPNADALADLAIANFEEMRAKTASRLFLLRKRVEKVLEGLLPGRYLALYTMVTHTSIPYAEARARAEAQERTIARGLAAAAGLAALAVAFAAGWALGGR